MFQFLTQIIFTMPKKSNRRDFLRGKAAARAIADAVESALPDGSEDAREREAAASGKDYLLRISRRAMACEFEICLNAGQYTQGMDAALEALDLVDFLESQLSVFREDSELAAVNRSAAGGPVEVSREVFELLQAAAGFYELSGGAFDISAAPLSDAWGFSRRQGRLPDDAELKAALELVGTKNVVLRAADLTVEFTRPGVRLDLGAVGKGYALDRCAAVFAAAGIENYMIHGGGSSVLAKGTAACGFADNSGWSVGLADPLSPGKRLGEIHLRDRCLATSGSAKQFFYHKGRRFSHILDPRTGRPAVGVLSATVLAPTATEAEVLSTTAFVLGPQKSSELMLERTDIGMIFVLPGSGGKLAEMVSFGLEDGDFSAK